MTHEQAEQIRQLEADIQWVRSRKDGLRPAFETETAKSIYAAPRRILARLENALAALTRA